MGEYQWGGQDNNDLGNEGNWVNIGGGAPGLPGPNDVAIIEFGDGLTGTLNVGALDLVQQGPGEPPLIITGTSTQVTAASAGMANTVTLDGGAHMQAGTLSTAPGCDVTVTGANTQLIGGDVALAGTFLLDAGAAMQTSTLTIAGGSVVTIGSGATLEAEVSTSNTMTLGSTSGTAALVITSGADVNIMSYDTNGDLNIGGVSGSYATLTVAGQASLYATPDNLVIGAGEDSNGLLSVTGAGSSAIFECWGTVYVGVAPGATGTVSVTNGGYCLLDSSFGVVDVTSDTMAKVVVAGAGSELDAGPSVIVGGETVYENAGKGEILVQSGGIFRSFDRLTFDSAGTGVVTGAGSVLQSSQVEIYAQASLQVASGGAADAGVWLNDGGLIKLAAGTVDATASYTSQSGGDLLGYGTLIAPKIVNGGKIDASGGTLQLTGSITGTGSLRIESGATLQLDSSVAKTQGLTFVSGTDTLSLADAHDFAAKLLDFGAGDTIDLLNTAATSLSYASGVLTVLDGSTDVAKIYLKGSYSGANFTLRSDGHGGSAILYSGTRMVGLPLLNPVWEGHFRF